MSISLVHGRCRPCGDPGWWWWWVNEINILPLQRLGSAPGGVLHHVSEELQPASTRTLYDAKLSDEPREGCSSGVASLGRGRDLGP